ncbi:phage tail protein I [Acinetobacter baumannii]|uniref:phage tail protein I n=1 Tax=Acinetobacter calcoaceticus/baumannii complex TaxID=909768 RepID=UPI00112BCAF3|nr:MULTISPECIES: phage tail protein I [Acinetobacter calcoaceticus/baumannii complex]MCZ2968664.1 phage tail protein I [Acinetobacter baumannii]MCZ3296080.1 phage tail protein I [Acinetobacter baumannii]MDA3505763.1 phage tail protein I [Acinetobacter baumannii]MDC4424775.1 phage tail protein I [Acinetobacter baumannii]MDN8165536.1 phage tail protein I [Acinetobacter baumannii]
MNLLPPNATNFENKLVKTTSKISEIDTDLSRLIRVDDAPSDFLSILAWQFSVDRWQDDWPDEVKRAQIKNSIKVHKYKGTNFALRSIVESFGYSLTIHEWWQESPMNEPGTFQITIDTNGKTLSERDEKTLVDLLKDAKPLTRELKAIETNVLNINGETNIACAMYDGEEVTIYPKQDELTPSIYPIFAHYGHDETTIYPRS